MCCYCLPAGTLCGWPMDAHTPTAAIMVAGGVEVFPFEVPTVAEGQNGGRRYQFMADSSELQDLESQASLHPTEGVNHPLSVLFEGVAWSLARAAPPQNLRVLTFEFRARVASVLGMGCIVSV